MTPSWVRHGGNKLIWREPDEKKARQVGMAGLHSSVVPISRSTSLMSSLYANLLKRSFSFKPIQVETCDTTGSAFSISFA
jgi:hypothetical protein